MPHYKDGTLAKIGDIVKGKGYNVPHEIIGPVLDITPGTTSCNIQIGRIIMGQVGGGFPVVPLISIEYGEASAFEKLADPPEGMLSAYERAGRKALGTLEGYDIASQDKAAG